MAISSWLRKDSAKLASRGPARQRRNGARSPRLFEVLEDRVVLSSGPTILTVTSLVDSTKGNTLRNAILQADKDTNKTYEIDITVVGHIELQSSLPDLANNITIVGQGPSSTFIVRDTAYAPFRIVTVDAGWTVALSGLSIEQGDAGSGNGGAIDNFANNLTLTNCDLDSNSATNGGAVENEVGASLTVTSDVFSGNHAGSYTVSSPSNGGGIDNNGTLTVGGTGSFSGNTASEGGGINNNGALTVSGTCTFDGNFATGQFVGGYGGGINNNGTGTVQVTGSTFSNNEADNHGGAIYNAAGQTLIVTTCVFQNNYNAQGTAVSPSLPFDGGGIENAGTLTVTGSRFDNNHANTSYGAGGAISNFGTTTVTQTTFGDGTTGGSNSAAYGGAIMNWGGANLQLGAGASFNDNSASEIGGAIDNLGTVNATGGSFSNNSASFYGGAIGNDGSLTATGTSFTKNTALDGGAILNNFAVTVSGCAFISNKSTGTGPHDGGGAIWNDGTTLSVQGNSTFTSNTAAYVGGAISNVGTATVSQSGFGDGTTGGSNSAAFGGAIMNWGGANLQLGADANFNDNSASEIGGAIDNLGTVNATGGSFSNNSAILYGGAIYNTGTVTATGTSFTNNTALDGGAIINYSNVTVSGCTFTSNHSTGTGHTYDGGGAIWSDQSLTVQNNCDFEQNTAAALGGGVFNYSSGSNASVSQSKFVLNSAVEGGAIHNWLGATLTVNVGSSFASNNASFGGAISNDGSLGITGASFTGNAADESGGAVYNHGAATVTNSSFSGKNHAIFGGAIFNNYGTTTLYGGQISDNSATYGGGIDNVRGVLNVLSGCQIVSNQAAASGGGIYTVDVGTTNIVDSVVTGNGPDNTHTVTSDGSLLNVNGTSIVPNQTWS